MAQFGHVDPWSEGSHHGQGVQNVPFKTSNASLKVLLLHGNLDIWVKEAKNLPNMDGFHNSLAGMFKKLPGNVSGKIEGNMSRKITSDPYVTISVSSAVIGRTFVMNNSESPIWMQHFFGPVAHYASEVQFVVKDNDILGSQVIGAVGIPAEHLWRGGKVTLYQDAHVHDNCLPKVILDHGMQYKHGSCWRDIFDAISQARRLIYITGWSLYHKLRLVRTEDNAPELTLGELLKTKSQEGVRVLLLIWDDPTSHSVLGYERDGFMNTNDEETRQFFKHSSVQVLLCPRTSGKGHSWIKKQVIIGERLLLLLAGLIYAGDDMTLQNMPSFEHYKPVHKDDNHNPNFTGPAVGCPREPWHDLHSQINGPAAYDILTNFEERWLRASKAHGLQKMKDEALLKIGTISGIKGMISSKSRGVEKKKKSRDDSLLEINRIPDIIGLESLPSLSQDDPEAWDVQVFRSIDSNSVKGFPKDPKDATNRNLVCGKNVLIDMSIQTAYVKAIRTAQHFIYIENQYFLGSSYNWTNYKTLGANNLIPMEIALKIASKIRANERFAVYIVIPMWPEGVPTSAPTQRILFWQHNTMQMMYEVIYKALEEVGLEKQYEPQDYLNFFCLGNRETQDAEGPSAVGIDSAVNTPQTLTRRSRRFMIYVHSKGMIVDDEYVILGSANINQRSLEGTRDTEIAMGAYQPQYTWASKHSNPLGQVYGYRMSLWAEHLGALEECFKKPKSLECTRRVRALSELNWKQFAADEITEMTGHLLKYPVEVDQMGNVKSLPDCKEFPDVGGIIVGSPGPINIKENLTI
ncbi:phospholipase D beta 1 [Actinidia rufa]|uniref:Phospholipase D n=1 Tax=Actinidia rufa TaxID=165716 RepID=A0A7J0FRB0_9ERIC|nr:phospholipase D beta 1 [Actinidia rufa]